MDNERDSLQEGISELLKDIDIDEIDIMNQQELKEQVVQAGKSKKSKKKAIIKELLDWVVVLGIGVLAALFISNFIILNAHIPSESMEKTIMKGDYVIGSRLSYLFSDPQRGDIVIFRYPDNEERIYIKRVIGTPGDTIRIEDGRIYVNDSEEPLEEPYTVGDSYPGRSGVTEYTVPEDSYFVMGDNRQNSEDSRFWVNTFVKKDKILAKAIFRYLPSFGLLDDYHD